MPSKPTISVVESEIHLGDKFHVEVTGLDSLVGYWAHAFVDDEVDPDTDVDYVQYIKLSMTNEFTAGPTPSWPAGGGSGTVELLQLNPRKGTFYARPIATTTFKVLP